MLKRNKDFIGLSVFKANSKKIGIVVDILIDFYNSKITGFRMNSTNFFSKKTFVDIKDIITVKDKVIISKISEEKGIPFSELKDMDVIDKEGLMIGVVEDIVVDELDFAIKGVIISSGIFDKILRGKRVLLMDRAILGDKQVLSLEKENIYFKSLPHKMVDSHE